MSGQPAIQSGGGAAPLSTNTNQFGNQFQQMFSPQQPQGYTGVNNNQFQQMLSPQNSNSGFKSSPGVGK